MRSGQALVVVLLIVAVVLTLGLSIASRGVTEINVSSVENDSSKALDAAEAGVESALGAIATPGPTVKVGTNSSYQINVVTTGSGEY
jgi:Tfp pilus assembly protein PilX